MVMATFETRIEPTVVSAVFSGVVVVELDVFGRCAPVDTPPELSV